MFEYADFGTGAETIMRPVGTDADTTLRPAVSADAKGSAKAASASHELEMVPKKSDAKDTASIKTSTSALGPLEWRSHEGYHGRRMGQWVGLRWRLLAPFNVRLPFGISGITLYGFTVGETMLQLAFIIIACAVCGASWSVEYKAIGKTAGACNIVSMFMIPRVSFMPLLLGVSFERALFWHKSLAVLSVALGFMHGLAYMDYKSFNMDMVYGNGAEHRRNAITGTAMFFTLALLIAMAQEPIRRHFFRVFRVLHIVLYLAVLILGALHGAEAMLVGKFFLILDNLFRHAYRVPRTYKATTSVNITQLPGDITRIAFSIDGFSYRAGQYVFVCVPGISVLEWHPIALSSAPGSSTATVHVKAVGRWSRKLHAMAGELALRDIDAQEKPIKVFFDGPYGEPMVDIQGDTYSHILLIAGGMGITPMLSQWSSLRDQFSRGRPLSRVHLVWATKDMDMVHSVTEDAAPQSTVAVANNDTAAHVFRADVYNTSPGPDDRHFIPDSKCFAGTELSIHQGRPDLAGTVMAQMRTLLEQDTTTSAAAGKRVAVMVCGPASLVKDVRMLCDTAALTKGAPAFDFHAETFEL